MTRLIIFMIFSLMQLYSVCSFSAEKSVRESCGSNIISKENKSCANILCNNKEKYERSFNDFYIKAIDRKKDIENFEDFIDNIEQGERLWRKYIIRECSAEADLKKEYSNAYLFTYENCMARHYAAKAKYYKELKLD